MASSNTSRSSSTETPSTGFTTPDESEILDPVSEFKRQSSHGRFERWRPSYHLQAPHGWMNDPCAPGYNSDTGLYHVSFQWNPFGNDWGNISWCSATSPDMLNWTVNPEPTVSPDQSYDCEGAFTGCLIHGRDGSLNYIYTSVSSLPIHHSLPHPKGCESLSLTSSYDNGRTWKKSISNPFLSSEPEGLDVTGWRDPYVAQWSRMSAMLRLEEGTLFGLVSGGIRDVTPTTFLYSVDADDLTKWEFIDPIVDCGHDRPLSRWSGNMGVNWECTNFVCDVKDDTDPTIQRDFVITSTESCATNAAGNKNDSSISRPNRNQLWMSVTPKRCSDKVTVSAKSSGYLDHGCMYAANSFYDPQLQRQIVWGWITEDDLCDELRHIQGWSGMLSLPRELRMQTIHNVTGACQSDLNSISSVEIEPDDHGSFTIRTLASQPCRAVVQALRTGPNVRQTHIGRTDLDSTPTGGFSAEQAQSLQWELDCSFQLSKSCISVGIPIQHCKDSPRSTTLLFNPRSETFTIHRPAFNSLNSSEVNNSSPESAPHTLFTILDSVTGSERSETLDIQAWRDNSVLEVFVNGRTAISTRLYAAEDTCGIQFFAKDSRTSVSDSFFGTELLRASLWDGIGRTVS